VKTHILKSVVLRRVASSSCQVARRPSLARPAPTTLLQKCTRAFRVLWHQPPDEWRYHHLCRTIRSLTHKTGRSKGHDGETTQILRQPPMAGNKQFVHSPCPSIFSESCAGEQYNARQCKSTVDGPHVPINANQNLWLVKIAIRC